MSAAAQIQEAEPIVVWVSRDRDGAHFRLHPWTRRHLERTFPGVPRSPQVSIDREHEEDFAELSETVQASVVALLTGMSIEQLAEQGEVRFTNPVNDATLASWRQDRR